MVKIYMLVVSIVLLICHLETDGATTICQSGWLHFARACYLFVSDKQTWMQALNHCAQLNSDLLAIEGSGENYFIKLHLQQKYMHTSGKDQVIYFTSGTDEANEDQWASTEQGIGFTDWYPGDPDGALGQNCLVLWGEANFEWIDASCDTNYNSICIMRIPINDTAIVGGEGHMEYDANAVPT